MSSEAVSWAWSQSDMKPQNKLILLCLCECASPENALSYPTRIWLAGRSCMTLRQVDSALKALAVDGYMSDTGKRAGAEKDTVVYSMNFSRTAAPALVAPEQISMLEGERGACERAIEIWNDMAGKHKLRKVRALSSGRRTKLRARLKEIGLEKWSEFVELVPTKPFLMGMNDRCWKADIDWAVRPDSYARTFEEDSYLGYRPKPTESERTMSEFERIQMENA